MGKLATLIREQHVSLPTEQRRQMLALDSEFEDMEAQITVLQAQNLKLQAQVNPLERKVQQLTEQIQHMQADAAAVRPEPLEPNTEKLLLMIANQVSVPFGRFPALLNSTNAQADYYISVLKRRGFIRYVHSYAGESGF